MKIGSFDFDRPDSVYICAEIGINHNGDLDIARKLIDIAAESGCNAVKFQKRTPDICVPEGQKHLRRETPWGEMSYLEYRHRVEFDIKQLRKLKQYAEKRSIDWFVSCWDEQSFLDMVSLSPVSLKLPSACLTDRNLVNRYIASGLPIIWSSGMSTLDEIDTAYQQFSKSPSILCHCNSSYPADLRELNLRCIPSFVDRYPNSIIGYSGHEVGLLPSIIAVVLGARFVERHITLNRAMWGTDQAASLEPQGLHRLVRDIRSLELILGDGKKVLYESELPAREKLRR